MGNKTKGESRAKSLEEYYAQMDNDIELSFEKPGEEKQKKKITDEKGSDDSLDWPEERRR